MGIFSLSLSVASEEYKLLHRLNQVTIAKYQDMTALTGRLNEISQRLNEKCKLKSNNVFLFFYSCASLQACTGVLIYYTSDSDRCQQARGIGVLVLGVYNGVKFFISFDDV